jgi:hypothetical protein
MLRVGQAKRPHWTLIAFIAWTVFVWAGRIRNGGSVVLAASFLVLAAIAVWRRGRWISVLAVWTIGLWAVRTPQILLDDQSGAFKVVHTVLAAVSIALAVLAERHVQRERQAAATPARL